MASGASELLTRLETFRRRATLVLFVQALCLSGAVTLVIGEAFVVAGTVHNVAGMLAAVATAALLAAAATAIVLRPDVRDIAASIDARLHLQDRLVAGWQFHTTVDPFSQLVVRDAHARVAAVRASDAVPFTLPRGIRAASAAAAIVSAVVIVATAVPHGFQSGGTGFGSVGGSATAAQTSTPASNTAATRQMNPAAEPSVGSTNKAIPASPRQESAADHESTATASAQIESSTEPALPSSGGTTELERGSTTSGNASTTNTGSDTADGTGAAGGGAASTSHEERGGGVANSTRDVRATGRIPPPNDSAYRASYQNGRAAAETAVAQNRVPADRRSYVRDYFVAIRPSGDK